MMNPTLISINGRGGSGKSTVGRLLMQTLESSAYFDFDAVTSFNPWDCNEEMFRLGHVNSSDLVENYFQAGFQFVVMSSGCSTQAHLQQLLDLLTVRPNVLWFWLDVDRDERRRRSILRARDGADSSEGFDLVEKRIGLYVGPPTLIGVECHELKITGLGVEEIVAMMLPVCLGNQSRLGRSPI